MVFNENIIWEFLRRILMYVLCVKMEECKALKATRQTLRKVPACYYVWGAFPQEIVVP